MVVDRRYRQAGTSSRNGGYRGQRVSYYLPAWPTQRSLQQCPMHGVFEPNDNLNGKRSKPDFAYIRRSANYANSDSHISHVQNVQTGPRRGKSIKTQEFFFINVSVLSFCIPSCLVSVCSWITDMSMDLDAPVPIAGDQQPVAATYAPLFFLIFFFSCPNSRTNI